MFGIGRWISKVASTCGHVVSTVAKTTATGISTVGELAAKVPLAGPVLHGTLGLAAGPLKLADSIVSGQRLDKALVSNLKSNIAAIREVAPAAQMLVSSVPGIGGGISGAIGIAGAIADGRPVTDALKQGIKDAIPGGPLAKSAFSLTEKVVSGENVLKAGLSSVVSAVPGLPPDAQKALATALPMVQALAAGKRIDAVALKALQDRLPPEVQKAVILGTAVAQGQNIQRIAEGQLNNLGSAQLKKLAAYGSGVIEKNPTFKAGKALFNKAEQAGYAVGIGVASNRGVNEKSLLAIRRKLTPAQKKGFDLALSTHSGSVTSRLAPKNLSPAAKAAWYATHGMTGSSAKHKMAMMKAVTKTAEARKGAVAAVKQVLQTRKEAGFWTKIKIWLGMK
jgi:hypothetical protein